MRFARYFESKSLQDVARRLFSTHNEKELKKHVAEIVKANAFLKGAKELPAGVAIRVPLSATPNEADLIRSVDLDEPRREREIDRLTSEVEQSLKAELERLDVRMSEEAAGTKKITEIKKVAKGHPELVERLDAIRANGKQRNSEIRAQKERITKVLSDLRKEANKFKYELYATQHELPATKIKSN